MKKGSPFVELLCQNAAQLKEFLNSKLVCCYLIVFDMLVWH